MKSVDGQWLTKAFLFKREYSSHFLQKYITVTLMCTFNTYSNVTSRGVRLCVWGMGVSVLEKGVWLDDDKIRIHKSLIFMEKVRK